jgi:hypothetical protein
MSKFLILISLTFTLLLPARGHCAGYFGRNPESAPSVFTYAWRGFALGAVDGLATGYLFARADGFEGDDWKPLVYGTGVGALVGSGVGFTLGFMDLSDNRPGTASIVLRDMVYGMGFGVPVGALTGGLFAIDSGKPEHILFGASIGALAGTGVGMIVGFIEGPRITSSSRHRNGGSNTFRMRPSLMASEDVSGSLLWMPSVEGTF